MNERKLYELSRNSEDEGYSLADFELSELLTAYSGTETDRFVKKYKDFYTDQKTSKKAHDEDW